jgi:hypothetical protein
MTDIQEVELIIGSRNDSEISAIEETLKDLEVTRWRDARVVDPITVLAVAAGVAKLIDALLALKKRLAARKDSPTVEIKTRDGRSIKLTDATPELLAVTLAATHDT